MGLSMLMVVFFHQHFVSRYIFLPFSAFGYWGVDFFLFLSGFGLSYSLHRKPAVGLGLWSFYGRRISRIMPTVLLVGWVQLLVNPDSSLLCAFGLNLWYIRLLLVMYIAVPFFFRFFSARERAKRWGLLTTVTVILSLVTIFSGLNTGTEKFILWPLERTPVFMLGLLFFHAAQQGVKLNKRPIQILLSLSLPITAAIALRFRLSDPGNLAAAMGVLSLLLLSWQIPFLCHLLHRLKSYTPAWLISAIEWCGICSLEIYAVHEFIFAWLSKQTIGLGWLSLTLGLLLTFISAYLLKLFTSLIHRAIERPFCRKTR